MTGHSATLDPRTHAVRSDLADVRLAERVFAPHYAAPMVRTLMCPSPLIAVADRDGDVLGMMAAGDTLEVLDISGVHAWGVAPGMGLVGYVDIAAIGLSGS